MIISKVGRRGQVTIPREVRRKIDLKEGDRIVFVVEGNDLVVRPMRQTLLDLRGTVSVEGEQDFELIRRNILVSRARERLDR